MTAKKGSTKKGAATTAKASNKTLAERIAAVLTHPDVPALIYNSLVDALIELDNTVEIYENPQTIEAILHYHASRRARKGGTR